MNLECLGSTAEAVPAEVIALGNRVDQIDLSHLPLQWQQLREAARCLDQEACVELIEQIPADASLTEQLLNLVSDCRFDLILELVQSS